MKCDFKKYDKNDIRLGDIYAFSNSEGDVLAEVKELDNELYLEMIKGNYWKPQYEYIKNDYLTDFDAYLVYRQYHQESKITYIQKDFVDSLIYKMNFMKDKITIKIKSFNK